MRSSNSLFLRGPKVSDDNALEKDDASEEKLIEDEEARREYDNFKNNALNDPKQMGTNSEIDQNSRIIKAVTCMDAKTVFKMVAATGSTIRFANDETLDLLINSQLAVHPRALNQMNRISGRNGKNGRPTNYNDLEEVMKLTQKYDKGEMDDVDYLRDIGCLLKDYQMITQAEIDQVTKRMKKMTQDADLRKHIGRMTPGEAYRMRTVLIFADKIYLDLAYSAAKKYGATSIESLAAWIEMAQLERQDFKQEMWNKISILLREWEVAGIQREGKTEDEATIIADEIFRERDLEVARQDLQYRQDAFKKSHKKTSEKNSDYRRFCQSFARRNAIIESNVAVSLNRICETIKKEEQPGIANPVVAYYLDRKHKKRLQRYYDEQGWEILADRSHFSGEKIGSFLHSLVGPIGALHPYDKIISQDGKYTITMYKTTAAVTKCKYDADREREAGEPTISSHFATAKRSPCTSRRAHENQNEEIQPTPVTFTPVDQTVEYNVEGIAYDTEERNIHLENNIVEKNSTMIQDEVWREYEKFCENAMKKEQLGTEIVQWERICEAVDNMAKRIQKGKRQKVRKASKKEQSQNLAPWPLPDIHCRSCRQLEQAHAEDFVDMKARTDCQQLLCMTASDGRMNPLKKDSEVSKDEKMWIPC